MYKVTSNIVIENATIKYRNFSGKEIRNKLGKTVNPAGSRNFTLIISDEELAAQLEADGWNIKHPNSEYSDDHRPTLDVSMRFENFPPRIELVNPVTKQLTALDANSVGLLDRADIENVDVIIRPYNWELSNGQSGVKAYLKRMVVTLRPDPLDSKYAGYEMAPEMSETVEGLSIESDDLPF